MAWVWMTPCKNGQCELSVRRDGINKIVIATQTPLTDTQVDELFWCIGAMQRSGKTLKVLLKEQEAVEPYGMNAERAYGICPKCGKIVFRYGNVEENHYCGICGQEVKWE